MGENTAIEWTDVTDNIIVVKGGGWWCRKITPGCLNCYAAKLNQNDFFGGNHLTYGGKVPDLILREDILDRWQRQTKARKHFVASMTDVFGEWVPRKWILRYLDAARAAHKQTFQFLTKRADVMASEVLWWLTARGLDAVPSNIWLGVSVEDQERADERIPHLLQIPAAVRFLSVEPLLGQVDITRYLVPAVNSCQQPFIPQLAQLVRHVLSREPYNRRFVDWVIVGGESGPGSRPMNPAWVRLLRDQCVAAGVPFFFKQWGEWGPDDFLMNMQFENWEAWGGVPQSKSAFEDDNVVFRIGKKVAGRLLDGREWNEFPHTSTPA